MFAGVCMCRKRVCVSLSAYNTLHELFSLNGFNFWLVNPVNRQSSFSWSAMYFISIPTVSETRMRGISASRLNCSFIIRCCWTVAAIISKMRVSASPILKPFFFKLQLDIKEKKYNLQFLYIIWFQCTCGFLPKSRLQKYDNLENMSC